MALIQKVFNPQKFYVSLGGIQITGIANTNDAIALSTEGDSANLAQGMNATTIVYAAAVTLNMTLKVLSSDNSCSIIDGIQRALRFSNTSQLPPGVSSIVSGGNTYVPLIVSPSGDLNYKILSLAWTVKNITDMDITYAGDNQFYRTFNFVFTDEIQNVQGALYTTN